MEGGLRSVSVAKRGTGRLESGSRVGMGSPSSKAGRQHDVWHLTTEMQLISRPIGNWRPRRCRRDDGAARIPGGGQNARDTLAAVGWQRAQGTG